MWASILSIIATVIGWYFSGDNDKVKHLEATLKAIKQRKDNEKDITDLDDDELDKLLDEWKR